MNNLVTNVADHWKQICAASLFIAHGVIYLYHTVYPAVVQNGGLVNMCKKFLYGNPAVEQTNQPYKAPKI